MSWKITGRGVNKFLVMPPGVPTDGGFFAGLISLTADGEPTHALIVAPRATGASGTGYTLTTDLAWKTTQTNTPDTLSLFDGVANTNAMIAAGINDHPAAKFCTELSIGGFTDWYMPARYEYNIAYFNLKPTTTENTTTVGENPYSVPLRSSNYTTSFPPRTSALNFRESGSEAFVDSSHWSSSASSANVVLAWRQAFGTGFESASGVVNFHKEIPFRVRAFRRIAL
jgi:hypothetical protein